MIKKDIEEDEIEVDKIDENKEKEDDNEDKIDMDEDIDEDNLETDEKNIDNEKEDEENGDDNKIDKDGFRIPKPKRKSKKNDKEYGVSRGVDFRNVSNVINFDFPYTTKNYVHRVGRTARAGNVGTAISLIIDSDKELLEKVIVVMENKKKKIQPYKFKLTVIEGFRYRVEDVLRSVTRIAVKNAKLQELKTEILNSKKLKMHFEENPHDFNFIKHDNHLQSNKIQTHLRYIPHYLLPSKSDIDNNLTKPKSFDEDIDSKIRLVYDIKQLRKKNKKKRSPQKLSTSKQKEKI